jgi:hypothetical protein
MLNQFINQLGTDEEKTLYTDLAEEYIQFAGWDIIYIPRDVFNSDMLLGRSDGDFNDARTIEAIVEPSDGLDVLNETYNKFGFALQYSAVFTIMQHRFVEVFGLNTKPFKGDILFLQHKTFDPKFDHVFEVRDVNLVNPLQFGGYVPMWSINASVWMNKGENIDSNIPSLQQHKETYTQEMENHSNESATIISEMLSGLANMDKDNPFTKTF